MTMRQRVPRFREFQLTAVGSTRALDTMQDRDANGNSETGTVPALRAPAFTPDNTRKPGAK
jgi:hypothetical protein